MIIGKVRGSLDTPLPGRDLGLCTPILKGQIPVCVQFKQNPAPETSSLFAQFRFAICSFRV
jgi:hypothetical protein